MSLAQGNNTPTRPRIEPGSPDPEADALTARPVRSPRTRFVSDLRVGKPTASFLRKTRLRYTSTSLIEFGN